MNGMSTESSSVVFKREELERLTRMLRDSMQMLAGDRAVISQYFSTDTAQKKVLLKEDAFLSLENMRVTQGQMERTLSNLFFLFGQENADLRSERLALAQTLEELLPEPEVLHKGMGILFSLDLTAADQAVLSADRSDLGRVVLTLFSNALRASSPGGRVEVAAKQLPGELTLTVRDEGCGLPEQNPEENRRCFLGGTGMGLLVCRRCCEREGWELTLTPNTDAPGTTASVRIPLGEEGGVNSRWSLSSPGIEAFLWRKQCESWLERELLSLPGWEPA